MNFLMTLLDSPVLHALAKTLLHFLWQGTFIAFVLYLALNALHKSKSELRYLCALTSLVACVVAPVATFFWFYRPELTLVLTDVILFDQSLGSVTANGLAAYLSWDNVLAITGICWIAGVFYLSVHLVLELFSVYQLPKRGVTQPEPDILQLFNQLVGQLHVNRLTRLLISLKAEVPMVVGFLKPVVLLPLSMTSGLTHAQLEMLLAHELAHVKRHDYLVNFLQTLVEITLFFHPLVKWISTQIRIEREYCCDDIAVNTCGSKLAYATALTDAETLRSQNIPQLAMAATGGDLKNRVLRIVDRTDCANKFTRSWHSMALAALIGVTLPVALFSAHAAYQHRVEEAFSDEITDQEAEVAVKFVSAEEPKTSINQNTLGKLIISSNVGQDQVQSFAQTTKQRKSNNMAFPAEHQKNIYETATATATASASASTPASAPTVISDIDAQSKAEDNTKPSFEAEQRISDDSLLEEVDVDSEPMLVNGVIEPEYLAVETVDLDQQIAAQEPLTADLQVSEQLEISDIDLSKVQIASREELITIIAPTLVRNARPNYPRMAVAKRAEAEVKVSFTVETNGTISKLSFDNHVPGYFKRSVRKALNEWRFEPGTIDGEIAAIRLSRIFIFSDPLGEVGESTRLKVTGSRIAKQT